MILEIPDTLVKNLQSRAAHKGVTMETYLYTLLDAKPLEPLSQPVDALSYAEWRENLTAFQRTRRTDLPILTDDAMSRQSIYEGR